MSVNKAKPGAPLSAREIEVLTLLAKGYSNNEIGEVLCIGYGTVNDHAKSLYVKLQVDSRAEAAVRACELGLHATPAAACDPVPEALICTILVMEGHEPGSPVGPEVLRRFANQLAAQVRKVAR